VTLEDVDDLVRSHFIEGQPLERLRCKEMDQLSREIREEKQRTRRQKIAHQEAGVLSEKLRRLANDFQASRAFLTAVELDLFTALGEGATAHEAAEQMGTDLRATEMLLNALSALGLIRKKEDHYYNGPDTGRYLRRNLPDDARATLIDRVNMWDGWTALTECVREGSSLGQDHKAGLSATQAYIAATHKIAQQAAPALVETLGLTHVRRVLDVGGGSGAHTVAVLKAHPDATAELMDLPPVIRIATRYIREAGMEQRIGLRAGDCISDAFGSGFDLVLMSYLLHLNPPEINRRLIAKAFTALDPGGRIVINDYVLNQEKTLPRSAALYALNMLVSTQGGNVYSFFEFRDWLLAAGFSNIKKVSLLGPTDVVTAIKTT
jgi:ubiquinone/menaquinone biosynthesis C-methylase UbiE